MDTNKPVIIGGITSAGLIALFQSILTLGNVSGWWNLSSEAVQAWMSVAQIGLPILIISLTTWWTTTRTTSLQKPTDEDGVRLIRADTKQPAKQEVRNIERTLGVK